MSTVRVANSVSAAWLDVLVGLLIQGFSDEGVGSSRGADFVGTAAIAYSASAVIVRLGLTPRFAGITEPSMT